MSPDRMSPVLGDVIDGLSGLEFALYSGCGAIKSITTSGDSGDSGIDSCGDSCGDFGIGNTCDNSSGDKLGDLTVGIDLIFFGDDFLCDGCLYLIGPFFVKFMSSIGDGVVEFVEE